jgi:hypothetical protein
MLSGLPIVLGLAASAVAVRQLLKWVKECPLTPDPWSTEVATRVEQPDVTEVCHRCSAPVGPVDWFCSHCGRAVGPYNNWMPYLHIFSEGEVLRNGVTDRVRPGAATVAGYLLFSLASYIFFAPIFWIFLIRNFHSRWQKGREETKQEASGSGNSIS